MNASTQYPALKPGIYFGLNEDIYHNDPALSRSDIVKILDSANTYWMNSWMNPRREKKVKSDEMIYGSAMHALLFEPKDFYKRFFIFPTEKWDSDRRLLVADADYTSMVESIKVLRVGKDSSLFLEGGIPEVTLVFDYNGVRYRIRIDYFGIVVSTEFKTARSLDEGYLKKEFRERGLHIQYKLYTLGRKRFKEQYEAKEAHIYGKVDEKFFRRFMAEEMNDFIFVFQRKTPPFPFLPLMPEDDTGDRGAQDIEKASRVYAQYMQTYGPNVPWPVSEGRVKRFSMIYGIQD
jgi:hypothetical protein